MNAPLSCKPNILCAEKFNLDYSLEIFNIWKKIIFKGIKL